MKTPFPFRGPEVTRGLVLSLFPGIGLLDRGFEDAGFCVVRGPDVIWGGDVRTFQPPAGRFEGVIGGDPCQSHSALANLVRAKGLEPSFPDLTPEFKRVVEEARPRWFLRENVPKAPGLKPDGYDVRSFPLDNWASLGEEQQRQRRFWFGVRDGPCPELRKWLPYAWTVPNVPGVDQLGFEEATGERALTVDGGHDKLDGAKRIRERRQAVTHRADPVPVKLGGGGKLKRTATATDGRTGHRTGGHKGNAPRYSLAEMLELQGLPSDYLDHCPFTMQGKRKAIGNGVPLPMSRALGIAVLKAMGKVHA